MSRPCPICANKMYLVHADKKIERYSCELCKIVIEQFINNEMPRPVTRPAKFKLPGEKKERTINKDNRPYSNGMYDELIWQLKHACDNPDDILRIQQLSGLSCKDFNDIFGDLIPESAKTVKPDRFAHSKSKYNYDSYLEYIMENRGKISYEQMARHIGTSVSNLYTWMDRRGLVV